MLSLRGWQGLPEHFMSGTDGYSFVDARDSGYLVSSSKYYFP
ncbi:hypothetical protein EMIT051CA3_60168 [Pseudomonas chlororaphis]